MKGGINNMELAEIIDALNHMKDVMKLVEQRLEEGVGQAQENLNKVYWMNIKIQNNIGKFSDEAVDRAKNLEAELSEIMSDYKYLQKMTGEILNEIDGCIESVQVITKGGMLENYDNNEQAERMRAMATFDDLNEKIRNCLKRASTCLERQSKVLSDEQSLDDLLHASLERKNIWFIKLRSLFKGVHM
jgi:hypothetical protein